MGHPPDLLSTNMVELRNKVIHNGKIPTYKECIKFGQAVIDLISPIEHKMLDKFPDVHKAECFALAESMGESVRKKYGQSPNILSISPLRLAENSANVNIEEWLERLRFHRKIRGMPSIGSELMRTRTIYLVTKET
jgi:hypothetical protein